MVTHSNILVWLPGKPDGQENLAGCSPWGSQRVRHDSFTLKLMLSLCKVLKLRLKKTLMHIHQVSRTVRYGEGAETTCPVWKSLMIISSFFFFPHPWIQMSTAFRDVLLSSFTTQSRMQTNVFPLELYVG